MTPPPNNSAASRCMIVVFWVPKGATPRVDGRSAVADQALQDNAERGGRAPKPHGMAGRLRCRPRRPAVDAGRPCGGMSRSAPRPELRLASDALYGDSLFRCPAAALSSRPAGRADAFPAAPSGVPRPCPRLESTVRPEHQFDQLPFKLIAPARNHRQWRRFLGHIAVATAPPAASRSTAPCRDGKPPGRHISRAARFEQVMVRGAA